MNNDFKLPTGKVTFIIRDASPLVYYNDSPTRRSVIIELTEDQKNKLKLSHTHNDMIDNKRYEEISDCFYEE